jgi:hypothetical protein
MSCPGLPDGADGASFDLPTMHTYRVFNDNTALVEVTQQQLDEAVAGRDALPTHLANAAGAARRRDLIGRLRATLGVAGRLNKLAAARALLALDDRAAGDLLRERAAVEADEIVASMFRAIALRLEGVEPVRRAFAAGDADPALSGALASIYNGAFDLVPGDVEFLLDAIAAYTANSRPWIANMDRDEWSSDLYVLVKALARGATLIEARERARSVLSQVVASRADRDTKDEVRKLLANM